MKQFVIISTVVFALCVQSRGDFSTPLTYTGRSTEAAGSLAYSSTLGGEVSAALALPLNPGQTIFDGGAYHVEDIAPSGVTWASWGYYGGGVYQARHFQAYFVVPAGLTGVTGFTLYSPYYTAAGNLVPIDDNAYFYLNGTYIGVRGTSYGASNAPLGVPGLEIHETNGWHQNGGFGAGPLAYLLPGTNIVDIVAEDTFGGGSTGPLNVLLTVVPEPSTILLVAGVLPWLGICLRRKWTR